MIKKTPRTPNIGVKVANGGLMIRGEKKEGSEGIRQGRYLSERNYGSFERQFSIPKNADATRIGASVKKESCR